MYEIYVLCAHVGVLVQRHREIGQVKSGLPEDLDLYVVIHAYRMGAFVKESIAKLIQHHCRRGGVLFIYFHVELSHRDLAEGKVISLRTPGNHIKNDVKD